MLSQQALKGSSFLARGFCRMGHVSSVLSEKTGEIPPLEILDRSGFRLPERPGLR